MNEKIVKKIELSRAFMGSFEHSKEKLIQYGVDGFTLGEYLDFLQSSVRQDAIDEFIESKIPLKARLLSVLDSGDEDFMADVHKLLEKQSRLKVQKSNSKDSIDL